MALFHDCETLIFTKVRLKLLYKTWVSWRLGNKEMGKIWIGNDENKREMLYKIVIYHYTLQDQCQLI